MGFWRTRSFRAAAALAALLAVYALAGFVAAPKLVRSALLKDIPQAIGATPAVGAVRVNPFLLQLTVDDFSLTSPAGEKLLGFERLFVDFDLSSIWHRAYTFGAIDLTSPFVNATVAKDGSLNLLQLRPKTAAKPQERGGPMPALRIGSLKISHGTMAYEDHSQPDSFAARLEPINFELRDFTTGSEGGRFTFTAASKLGERIEWHGHVSVQPIESDGEFRIDGLKARTLWEYLEDKVNFAVDSGTIDLAATYRLSAAHSPAAVQADLTKFTVDALTVRPKDSQQDWITLPALAVTGTTVDLAQHRAHADLIAITGIKVLTWLEPDGSVNLARLGRAPAPATSSAPAAPDSAAIPPPPPPPPPPTASSGPAGPPWQFDVRQFEIRDASLSAEDRTVQPAVKAELTHCTVVVKGLSQDLSKPVGVHVDTGVNASGKLAADGDVTPQPFAANLTVNAADLELAAVQPYIAKYSSMTLLAGRLGLAAKLHYGTPKDPLALQVSANVDIDQLHTVDDALHDDFVNWERLEIAGLNYGRGPDHLEIEQIVARKPYARVIIESDESMNVKRVLTAPGAAAPGTLAPGESAPASARSARTDRSGKRPASTPRAAGSGAMPVSIKKVVVESGQVNFTDLSVTPNFSTGIQALAGTVTGISSKPASRATVDLHGAVDQYSPVAVTGEFNVLGPKLYTDIAMSFRNMELTVFNPYSGKFAGYDISKGKLTTELHYKVDGRSLDAQHHIIIDQLEFGEKTESKDAVSLPVKLAVSLLKDRNGVIDLNLPVTGSLDDPKFRLAPIIWKVFVNILERAVTAPFALLGNLFGGGPDIQFIDFEPGSSALDPAASEKARTVAKALVERPQLKIEVPIAASPDLDRPALIAARFAADVGAAQSANGGAKKSPGAPAAPPSYDELDAAAKVGLLTRVYRKEFGAEPKFPDAVSGIKSKADLAPAKADFLEKAIRDHLQVAEADLQVLGQERAKAMQQALLADGQVAADRVFLVANDKAVAKDGVVRLELTLK